MLWLSGGGDGGGANLPFLSHENGSLGMVGRLDKFDRVGKVGADVIFADGVVIIAVVVVISGVIVGVIVSVVIAVELYGV